MVEVRAEHGYGLIGIALAERTPCLPRLGRVRVEVTAPSRLGDLHRVMHEVAGDHRLLAIRSEPHADVTGRVPRCGLEPKLVRDAMVHVHELGQSGVE